MIKIPKIGKHILIYKMVVNYFESCFKECIYSLLYYSVHMISCIVYIYTNKTKNGVELFFMEAGEIFWLVNVICNLNKCSYFISKIPKFFYFILKIPKIFCFILKIPNIFQNILI